MYTSEKSLYIYTSGVTSKFKPKCESFQWPLSLKILREYVVKNEILLHVFLSFTAIIHFTYIHHKNIKNI